MPIFTGAVAAITTAFASISIGSIATQLLAGVALNALSAALADPVPGQTAPSIKQESSRGVVPRSIILGRTATPGSFFFENTAGLGDAEEHKFYVVGHCISDIPVKGLVEVWVNDLRCNVGGTYVEGRGYKLLPPASYPEDMQGWITFYDGTQTTADPVLLDAAEEGYEWTNSDILRGCAYAVCVFKADPDVFGAFPQVQYVVDGANLPDAGTGNVGTGNDLPAVQIDNLLKGIFYNDELMYGPQTPGILENVAEQANVCRQPVPSASGWTSQKKIAAFGSTTVPAQYRAGMEIPVNMPIADAMSQIMAAANAKIAFTGSGYSLLCGEPVAPVASLSSDDIILDREQGFSPFLPLAETINSVIGIYPEPKRKWQDREVPPLIVPAYEADDGNRRLPTTVQLRTVSSGEQCKRLMRHALAEARRAARVTITVGPEWTRLQPLDVVTLTDNRTGSDNKLYRIDGIADEPNGDMTLDLTEVDPSDYAYEAEDFTEEEIPQTTAQPLGQHYLLGFNATPYSIEDNNGVARRPGIRMSWEIDQAGRNIAYHVQTADTQADVTKGTAALKDGVTFTADGIVPGGEYRVRGRKLLGKGKTPWSEWITVTVPFIQLGPDDIKQSLIDDIVAQAELSAGVADAIAGLQLDADAAQQRLLEIETLGGTGTQFASLVNQLEVNQNGISAVVDDFQKVATDVDGFAAAYAGITVQTSGGSIAGFKATSFTNPDGTGGSLLNLLGDVVKVGTLSANRFSSGNGTNELRNASYINGLRYWRRVGTGNVFDQTTMELKPAGTAFATPSSPTLRLRQVGISLNGYCDARAVDEKIDGTTSSHAVPTSPGKWYMASAQVCTRDCSGNIYLLFLDANGGGLATYEVAVPLNSGAGNNPEAWTRIHTLSRQAPAGAASATVFFRKNGTQGGASGSDMYIHKPSLDETHAAATVPAEWSNGGDALIDGGAVFADSIGVGTLIAGEFAALGLALFGDDVRSTNYIPGVRGWRIPIDGPAEFPLGIKTGDLSNNAATDADRANGGELFNATDVWQTMCQMTFTGLNTSSYDILGIMQVVLTNDPSAYPNDFAIQLLIGADLGVLINKNTLNANGDSRFLVFPIVKVAETAGTLKLELRTRNGGGSGILNSNMWAMVRKK